MKRIIIVPVTAEIDEFHNSASEISSVTWTSFKSGEIENLVVHNTNTTKKKYQVPIVVQNNMYLPASMFTTTDHRLTT